MCRSRCHCLQAEYVGVWIIACLWLSIREHLPGTLVLMESNLMKRPPTDEWDLNQGDEGQSCSDTISLRSSLRLDIMTSEGGRLTPDVPRVRVPEARAA